MDIAHRLPEAQARAGQAPPSPWPRGAAYAAAALATAVLGLAAGLDPAFLLLVSLALLVAGAIETGERLLARQRTRAEADAWILQAGGAFGSRRAWRVTELTRPRQRRLLSGSLRGVVSDLSRLRLPGASPVNRALMRPHAGALAERVGDLDRPVAARGILRVRWLLTSPGSPVYAPTWPRDDTVRELATILSSLEVSRP